MLNKPKTTSNFYFGLVGLIGLFCMVWLMVYLNSSGNEPINQLQIIQNESTPNTLLNLDEQAAQYDADRTENSTEVTGSTASINANSESVECSGQCGSTLAMLEEGTELDDEAFIKFGSRTKEIAAYLQNHESERRHYLQMAMTTADDDKRAFLTDVFSLLPDQQKIEIGESFVSSDNWRLRADGVLLIAGSELLDSDVVNRLTSIYSSEQSSYVKSNILKLLQQSSTLQGDTEIMYQLDSDIYTEENPNIRVAALKAKMRLSNHPYQVLPDVLQALRTSEPDLQYAGLIAINQILDQEQEYNENGVYVDRASIKSDVMYIRNMTAYDDKRLERVISEANAIYLRYFE